MNLENVSLDLLLIFISFQSGDEAMVFFFPGFPVLAQTQSFES